MIGSSPLYYPRRSTMDIQRLRSLTTRRLHTDVRDVYKDIALLTGQPGIMTHQIPNALRALEPFLRQRAPEPRLWDGQFDQTHTGEIEVLPMSGQELNEFMVRYAELPDPLEGKTVIGVTR
ncbi:hypothetical protein P9A47_gp14 [Xanthomonas phage Elanor]|uniref:DUF7736 domain-containing protein n=1 Tax=Xanthomonas phage Elanor TaxID=2939127 RepID=A0A9E7E175_9CAUD|nr:hypothetical protein P9A47_gp14 [Xanthomonas phage Elanor]URA06982.1 hypothetical protein Elanor_BL40014 [Xanthomonas phage Elanor]